MVDTDQSRPVVVPHDWADPAPLRAPAEPFWRRVLPLLAWVLCLAVALGLLLALGDGRLAAPPLSDPAAWGAWAAGRDPFEVAGVVLRLLALGLAWYLVGVTSISVLARALRLARLVQVADALSFGPIRVLAQQAVGVGLAVGVLATAVPGTSVPVVGGPSTHDRSEAAVESAVEPAGASATLTPLATATASGRPVTLQRTAAGSDATAAAPDPVVPAPIPAPEVSAPEVATPSALATPRAPEVAARAASDDTSAPTAPAPTAVTLAPREVRVEPGDHLWSLAERDVAQHLGRPGTDREVATHWRTVVDANLDRLEIPGNPDFLLPGQLVVLPPVGEVGP